MLSCLVDTGLALLVDEFGEISGSDLAEIGDAKNKANRI